MHEKLRISGDLSDLIMQMSQGNIGAVSVLVKLFEDVDPMTALPDVLHLDDMNMRGPQIWVGYNDYCGQNIEEFRKCLRNRDASMVEKVNSMCCYRPGAQRAVTHGASFEAV
jgi:hypothetical protein